MNKVYLALLLTASFLAHGMDGDEPPQSLSLGNRLAKLKQRSKAPISTHSDELMVQLRSEAEKLNETVSEVERSFRAIDERTTDVKEKSVDLGTKSLDFLSLRFEVEGLKKQLQEADEDHLKTKLYLDEIERRIRELQQQKLVDVEEKKKHLIQISTLESEKLELQSKVAAQEEEIARLRLFIQELEARIRELEAQLEEKSLKNALLQEQLGKKREKKREYKEKALQLSIEKSKLSEKLDILERDLLQETSKLQGLSLELKDGVEENSRITMEKSSLEENLARATSLNKELEKKKKEIEEKLSQSTGDRESLEEKLRLLTVAQEDLRKKMEMANQELLKSEGKQLRLEDELEQMRRQNEQLQKELKEMGRLYQQLQERREKEIIREEKERYVISLEENPIFNSQAIGLSVENTLLKAKVEKLERDKKLLAASYSTTIMPIIMSYYFASLYKKPKEQPVQTQSWFSWLWEMIGYYNPFVLTRPGYMTSIPYFTNYGFSYANTWTPNFLTPNFVAPNTFGFDQSWKRNVDAQWERSQRLFKSRQHKKESSQLPSADIEVSTSLVPVTPKRTIVEEPKKVVTIPSQSYDEPPFDMEFLPNIRSSVWNTSPSQDLERSNTMLSRTMTKIKSFWGS